MERVLEYGIVGLVVYAFFKYYTPKWDKMSEGFTTLASAIQSMVEHSQSQQNIIKELLEKNNQLFMQQSEQLNIISRKMERIDTRTRACLEPYPKKEEEDEE